MGFKYDILSKDYVGRRYQSTHTSFLSVPVVGAIHFFEMGLLLTSFVQVRVQYIWKENICVDFMTSRSSMLASRVV